jgi:thioredoxin-like negative regulator of GroEL
MSIPTIVLFKDGNVLEKLVGLVPKGRLEELIRKGL